MIFGGKGIKEGKYVSRMNISAVSERIVWDTFDVNKKGMRSFAPFYFREYMCKSKRDWRYINHQTLYLCCSINYCFLDMDV